MAMSLKAQTLARLKNRGDFLQISKLGKKAVKPGFILRAAPRACGSEGDIIRIGFTCSKKIGNAVLRNRAKRRLRALAEKCLPAGGRVGWDYVLIGCYRASVEMVFAQMERDLYDALAALHKASPSAFENTLASPQGGTK